VEAAPAHVAGRRCLPEPLQSHSFYSSAVNNGFIEELRERSERQAAYTAEPIGEHTAEFGVGPRKRVVYLTPADLEQARSWEAQGFIEALRTPTPRWSSLRPRRRRRFWPTRWRAWGA